MNLNKNNQQKQLFRSNYCSDYKQRKVCGKLDQNFSQLPINKNCADNKWLKDKEHLSNCDCLEQEAKELYLLFTNSLQKQQKLLKNCQCKKSEKVRVGSDNYTWCESCQREISAASKKRVIKNRTTPFYMSEGHFFLVLIKN